MSKGDSRIAPTFCAYTDKMNAKVLTNHDIGVTKYDVY